MADLKQFERKMEKTLEVLASDFGAVRAGRANAQVLDRIEVEYYGTPTPINQVGTISSPDPRTLVIQPWDGGLLKPIEKAIQVSDLGINPQNDGRVIRLVFPQLTEERRKELAKQVKKYGEDAKVAIRNVRRDAVDFVKNGVGEAVGAEKDDRVKMVGLGTKGQTRIARENDFFHNKRMCPRGASKGSARSGGLINKVGWGKYACSNQKTALQPRLDRTSHQ